MTKVREHLGWTPEWNETFRGWAINFIKKNRWRCEGLHDFEDLLQDAYLTFRRVKAAYPRVTEAKHFMSLYKSAMTNEMFDKARYKQNKQTVEVILDEEAHKALSERIGVHTNEGMLRALIAELPPEAKLLLSVMNDPQKLEKLRQRHKRSRLAKMMGVPNERENLNATLCRILRMPRGTDFTGPLREALKA